MSLKPVLFVHHTNDMYGADIGLLHSIQSIDGKKYYPIVILPSEMPTGMLSPELERLGVEFIFAKLGILRRKRLTLLGIMSLSLEIIQAAISVSKIARSRGAALIYVNTFVAVSGAIGGKLAGIPVMWHIREILYFPRPIRLVFYKLLGLCATRVVCISKAVRDSILKDAPQLGDKSVLIYNAVSEAPVSSASQQIGIRDQLKIPEDRRIVGMIGRLLHWKGQEVLALAAAIVLKSYPDVHFIAAGSYFGDESHYLDSLQSLIDRLGIGGRFHLIGYRRDVTRIYRELNMFVLPSTKPEPFGRVTVEAMTQGLPVIATNHGGTVELIQDGVTGLLIPPSNPHSLASAINMLLADPQLGEKIGRAAACYAKNNFSLQKYCQSIRQVVEELVA